MTNEPGMHGMDGYPLAEAAHRCDIRGCEGAGTERFCTSGDYIVDLCVVHADLTRWVSPAENQTQPEAPA